MADRTVRWNGGFAEAGGAAVEFAELVGWLICCLEVGLGK
jgi:hypothetical protein